jgi:ATP-dependent DNA helicase RecG
MRDKEFELILDEGEGYRIEFKENATNIDKEMVAFANASGGRIFVGITDNKKVVGINIDNRSMPKNLTNFSGWPGSQRCWTIWKYW